MVEEKLESEVEIEVVMGIIKARKNFLFSRGTICGKILNC